MIATKVVHSQSKSAWNVVGTKWGGKYKIAIVPYVPSSDEDVTLLNRQEAYTHAMFISNAFNAQAK
jgi:hypothetical protein